MRIVSYPKWVVLALGLLFDGLLHGKAHRAVECAHIVEAAEEVARGRVQAHVAGNVCEKIKLVAFLRPLRDEEMGC
jgi:hypothetical protein